MYSIYFSFQFLFALYNLFTCLFVYSFIYFSDIPNKSVLLLKMFYLLFVTFTPYRRAKGKFHYPIAGLFSASLKMKIKIFFLLEIVRNDVKKHKIQLFPFRFHLT